MNVPIALVLHFLICNAGGPGGARQASGVTAKFMRQIERAAGLKEGSLAGHYETRLKRCDARAAELKPAAVVADLATFLAREKAWKLKPLATMGPARARRYHLLVKKGGPRDLAALAGKTVITPLARDPRFVWNVVLQGKVPPAKRFRLKATRRPLKGIRAVARGRAAATIVDDRAHAHLGELPLPAPLVSIYTSPPLPGLTLALTADGRRARGLVKKLLAALPKICRGEGAPLCKTFAVAGFEKAPAALYRRLSRRYNR